ncbi:hypothetical protein JCM10207_007478 [Rhodosporidiobolus poonsookiae]
MATASNSTRTPGGAQLDSSDFLETRSVQLEWKVSNLKQLFDQTKGDLKSKCVKSSLFDNSRWQIFLYPNSGHEQYMSLYLSCEPTAAEKERALAEQAGMVAGPNGDDGKSASGKEKEKTPWRRDGKFKFTFEVRSADRRVVFKTMEADNHSFTWKERNWGYASMISRREAYYNNPNTRAADAFLIVCTIVSSPSLPTSPPAPHLLIPKDLVRAYASLFNDPDYSDIVFRIRPENGARDRNGKVKEKKLYAAKKVLAGRSEYFDTMLNSGFNESTIPSRTSRRSQANATLLELDDDGEFSDDDDSLEASEAEDEEGWDEDDDSQVDESEYEEDENDAEEQEASSTPSLASALAPPFPSRVFAAPSPSPAPAPVSPELARTAAASSTLFSASAAARSRTSSASLTDDERDHFASTGQSIAEEPSEGDEPLSFDERDDNETAQQQQQEDGAAASPSTPPPALGIGLDSRRSSHFVDAPSAPASPVKPEGGASRTPTRGGAQVGAGKKRRERRESGDGRARFEVVVTDAAYSTYRSLLNYLYTDAITFSPLASTYYVAKDHAATHGLPFPYPSRRAYLAAHSPQAQDDAGAGVGAGAGGVVGACSSKAIYRLADKMGLTELKERAYEHIVKSLNAQNIVYEVFGSFSQRFDEIRRVEIAFLLEKWNDVRSSSQMRKVFEFLRSGRFPGFEDVWLELVANLEVKLPPAVVAAPVQGAAGGAGQREGEGEEAR